MFLPLMVTSLITNYTKPSYRVGSKLPKRMEKNYRKMDPARGDERTYMIDQQFNGPQALYNIFPGTRFLNRGQRSPWTYLNNAIAKFVHDNVDAYVYLTVILSYDFEELYQSAINEESPKLNVRPNAIGVNVRFYNNEHELTDDKGVPLDDRPNPYENMFFNNNADHCCELDFTDYWN
ncbi:hypothetical protein PYW08_003347 [Mythimna loreyi]|uniref:Uncharacterized protein n=1 Tax=Mythimna loreyi TaxID=667449 RepID=A0ACC2QRH6_9NEOP|nr:hypothetical protein PYW08_003347 [Mythimna loreyi]